MVGFVGGQRLVCGSTRSSKAACERRGYVVAVAAAERSAEVESVAKKGFHQGVSNEAVGKMAFVRCHKSILARGGLSVLQAQLFTKVDTAKTWLEDKEYDVNSNVLPGTATSKTMRDSVDKLTADITKALQAKYPKVSEEDIAIFEFDLERNILRIMSYGIAAHATEGFLHPGNVALFDAMFSNVGLPDGFFKEGVAVSKAEVLKIADSKDKSSVEAAFGYLESLL